MPSREKNYMTCKSILMINLLWMINAIISFAQPTGYYQSFDGNDISNWEVSDGHDRTYQLSAENNTLKINYTRTQSSWEWDNIHFNAPYTLDVHSNPMMTVRIKSSVNTVFAAKMVFDDNGDTGLKEFYVVGDNTWRTVSFQFAIPASPRLTRMYFYLDGGTTVPKEGVIYLDDFRLGDSAFYVPDFSALERAISDAQNLLLNSEEGTDEGTFPFGSKSILQQKLDSAMSILNSGTQDSTVVENAVWNLYDACSTFEKNVNSLSLPIVDPLATKQTRYLYMNLNQLTGNALIFGMQDATGMGYGWSGDDDRSDIKDVCGDYPGLFSEDINAIELNRNIDRMRYRLSSAYERGAVISMVWHQYDPDGRGFYSWDVNNERIVSTIIPGGPRHENYKNKLRRIALFLKSLRGSHGESIPVIFRPYHEHMGNWFWWGPAYATTSEFNTLWQFTVQYLRDSLNVHNLLWALSPSLDLIAGDTVHTSYFSVYPGDSYVDVFGTDYYFGDNPVEESGIQIFSNLMHTLATWSIQHGKLTALTEVGQKNLPTPNWFTQVLLNPIKYDSINCRFVYAAVWRNVDASQFFAPYPGHSSVPDFLSFYDDPYTMFTKDLPAMYQFPVPDTVPPLIVSNHDSTYVSYTTDVNIKVVTNERAYLRYSLIDDDYQNMPHQFQYGEGGYIHNTIISSTQGESGTIFVRAKDVAGNTMTYSVSINYTVDTLERPIPWYAFDYPDGSWNSGKTPMGSATTDSTITQPVRTLYVRKKFILDSLPTGAALVVKGSGGCAVFLNDKEISRYNLPMGELKYETNPTTGNTYTKQFVLDSGTIRSMVIGENIFSIELHALPPASVQGFNAYFVVVYGTKQKTIFSLGSVWSYFDQGYRPQDVKLRDILGTGGHVSNLPGNVQLYQNYPNPFNATTRIKYVLPKVMHIKLEIYDVLGRRISVLIDRYENPGLHEIQWNAGSLSSGIYFLHMNGDNFLKVQKMVLLK